MSYDWSWFFSSFSQCSAALIGIIAAFIISKLLGESEKLEFLTKEIEELFIKKNDIILKFNNRNFDWYDRSQIKYSYDLKQNIDDKKFKKLSCDEDKLNLLFSIIPNLFGVDKCLKYLDSRIENSTMKFVVKDNIPIPQPPSLLDSFPPDDLWDKLSVEREVIHKILIDSIILVNSFKLKLNEIGFKSNNIKPIKVTIYFLMAGIFLTVIYPLHFLPVSVNESPVLTYSFSNIIKLFFSITGFHLSCLTIIINGILLYFLILAYSIERRYYKLKNKITPDVLDLKSWSEFFKLRFDIDIV
jgi:hypothetical protein